MIMKIIIKQIREIWNIKVVVYLDDLILLHQDQRSGQRSGPIPKMAGMDSKSREIPLNPVKDVEILRMGVEFKDIIGPLTERKRH
jgi:hypothetical protein